MAKPLGERKIVGRDPQLLRTQVDFLKLIDSGGDVDDLIKMLEKTNPDYDTNIDEWRRMGDVGLARIVTDNDKKRYLIQGDVEPNTHYDKRVSLSEILSETPGLLNDFIGAVFSKSAKRAPNKEKLNALTQGADPTDAREASEQVTKLRIGDRIQQFIDAAGPAGEPIAKISEKLGETALVFGSADIMLDHPETGSQIPRAILYTPEQRLDWQDGPDGNFAWVKYVEKKSVQRTWDGKRLQVDEYRIISAPSFFTDSEGGRQVIPGGVELFRVIREDGEKDKVEISPVIFHKFPSIPVRTLYWKKLKPGVGAPWIKPLVNGDIKIFRADSDLTWDVFIHAHPWIIAWLHKTAKNQKPLNDIKLGQDWALHLDPGTEEKNKEDVAYRAPDSAPLDVQRTIIDKSREMVRLLAGNGAELDSLSSRPDSGVAIAFRMAQRAKNFFMLAGGLQEIEWLIAELVASEGRTELIDIKDMVEIVYPDQFDQRLTEDLIRDMDASEDIGSPTLVIEVKKKLATVIIGTGTSQDKIDAINDEIEKAPTIEPSKDDDDDDE